MHYTDLGCREGVGLVCFALYHKDGLLLQEK